MSYGAEDMPWAEPENDFAMQDAMVRALSDSADAEWLRGITLAAEEAARLAIPQESSVQVSVHTVTQEAYDELPWPEKRTEKVKGEHQTCWKVGVFSRRGENGATYPGAVTLTVFKPRESSASGTGAS